MISLSNAFFVPVHIKVATIYVFFSYRQCRKFFLLSTKITDINSLFTNECNRSFLYEINVKLIELFFDGDIFKKVKISLIYIIDS